MPIDCDGSDVIQRQVDISSALAHGPALVDSIGTLYEIDKTVAAILSGGYQRIALQFPDDLLCDSTAVSSELQRCLNGEGGKVQVFILADTSYGSCCVDEVAAEHNAADFIVHYGRTCLSLTSRLPVLYVFGRLPIDPVDCANQAAEVIKDSAEDGVKLFVLYDMPYAYAAAAVCDALRDCAVFECVEMSHIADNAGRLYDPRNTAESKQHEGQPLVPLTDYTILYLGGESLALTNILLTLRCRAVFSYDPPTRLLREESALVNRHLARRYKMVQHARDADVIGIVVGTLAATRYLRVIEALKEMVRRARKKAYVFVVGKLNVAKLANFAEIDAFVLVACPENSLVDSREFFRPLVTPYELQLALSRSRQWTGDYVTDFRAFLNNVEPDIAEGDYDVCDNEEDGVPHFSMVTGTLKQNRRFNDPRQNSTGSADSLELTARNQRTEIARYMGSAGAEYLLTRSFRGLGHDSNDSTIDGSLPALAVEGRSGIARGYDNEK
ncbi:Diphthamide biosynthesis protein 2 [Coemansia thaxteri]|uniref:2-(3-amino-3-carboxypropyl)histidine synthase subunit 2 n=1 Tax=Coemansia thaxteri TaxID=2663907 RepID=A0A9W8BNV1_9FUNG|nr:Diphthamide biosynthesis protein 2 [Coemansia thaxteri]KAJ2487694.1 Diphthamide biosynthesis protein 2 [Coemansia sp. RSA 2320]